MLRRYRATGVERPERSSPATSPSGPSSAPLASVLVVAVGAAFYGVPAPDDPAATIAWFVAGLACFIAIGGALGVLMPSSRAATALGNLVFVPMFLLGGWPAARS